MNLVAFFLATPYVAVVVLLCTFYLKRAWWKLRRRTKPEYAGFYPSASSLGNAFHSLRVRQRAVRSLGFGMASILIAAGALELGTADPGNRSQALFNKLFFQIGTGPGGAAPGGARRRSERPT